MNLACESRQHRRGERTCTCARQCSLNFGPPVVPRYGTPSIHIRPVKHGATVAIHSDHQSHMQPTNANMLMALRLARAKTLVESAPMSMFFALLQRGFIRWEGQPRAQAIRSPGTPVNEQALSITAHGFAALDWLSNTAQTTDRAHRQWAPYGDDWSGREPAQFASHRLVSH